MERSGSLVDGQTLYIQQKNQRNCHQSWSKFKMELTSRLSVGLLSIALMLLPNFIGNIYRSYFVSAAPQTRFYQTFEQGKKTYSCLVSHHILGLKTVSFWTNTVSNNFYKVKFTPISSPRALSHESEANIAGFCTEWSYDHSDALPHSNECVQRASISYEWNDRWL